MGHIKSLESITTWIESGAKKLLIVAIFITACIQGKRNMVFDNICIIIKSIRCGTAMLNEY